MKAFPQAAISLMSHVDSNLLNSCNTLPDLCKCRNANPLVLFVALARYQTLWTCGPSDADNVSRGMVG